MTIDKAIMQMYDVCAEQDRICAIAEKELNEGRMTLPRFLGECFLLVYDCAKLDLGLWKDVGADWAACMLTRHWREFPPFRTRRHLWRVYDFLDFLERDI